MEAGFRELGFRLSRS